MENNFHVDIYRRLDNRFEGLPDDSPRALELHNLRKEALHDILDNQAVVEVENWGDTDDTQSHELITITLSVVASALAPIAIAGLRVLGEKLLEAAVDEGSSKAIKWLVSKFSKKQKEKKLLNLTIIMKDGPIITVDTPENVTKIIVNTKGEQTVIEYES